MKGFIVAPKERIFHDFCRDAGLDPREYKRISTLGDLRGTLLFSQHLPVYLVAMSFAPPPMDWVELARSPYYKDLLNGASVVLRPTPSSKWY